MSHCKDRDMGCEFDCLPDANSKTVGGSNISGKEKGFEYLTRKNLNRGLAFTIKERQLLGLHGLLPAAVRSEQEQIKLCTIILKRFSRNLDKYNYLTDLCERNERLFYRLLASDIEQFLPLICAHNILVEVCKKFSLIYQQPSGIFLTINDKNHVYEVLRNWPQRDVRAIVVTDGARILSLGDVGANGMAVPISKLMIDTVLAGIDPQYCVPICLDCGTNDNHLILDPLYIGLREQRIKNKLEYQEFVNEFMTATMRHFGPSCILHFEGFSRENAFDLLDKYRNNFCIFNENVQCEGAIILSGILSAMRALNTSLKDQNILFIGGGQAAIGAARLCHYAMVRCGVESDVAKQCIWLFDSNGLIVKSRECTLSEEKLEFVHDFENIESLTDAIATIKPSVLIGASLRRGVFSKEVLQLMASINERPVVLVHANCADSAECTAQQAYQYTQGRCLFAAGTEFPPVDYQRKRYFSSQFNTTYIFPGITLGVVCAGMYKITDEVFYIAAETLCDMITGDELAKGSLYPARSKLVCFATEIAKWVMEYGYRFNLATVHPEPKHKVKFIKSQMYTLTYSNIFPNLYSME